MRCDIVCWRVCLAQHSTAQQVKMQCWHCRVFVPWLDNGEWREGSNVSGRLVMAGVALFVAGCYFQFPRATAALGCLRMVARNGRRATRACQQWGDGGEMVMGLSFTAIATVYCCVLLRIAVHCCALLCIACIVSARRSQAHRWAITDVRGRVLHTRRTAFQRLAAIPRAAHWSPAPPSRPYRRAQHWLLRGLWRCS